MATENDRTAWYGSSGEVSQRRGQLFKFACLGAALFGLAVVGVLLAKVTLDATRPTTADVGWLATYLAALVAPTLLLVGYYAVRDPAAGWIGANAVGTPVFGLLFGVGMALVFVQLVSPVAWFAFVLAAVVAGAVSLAYRRFRPQDPGVAHTLVTLAAGWLAVVGVPGSVPSLASVVRTTLPVLPSDLVILIATLALPVAVAAGYLVDRRYDSRRGALAAAGVVAGGSVLAGVAGLFAGPAPHLAVVVTVSVVAPTTLYVASVLDRGEHVAGLWAPVVVFGGAIAAAGTVRVAGFAGPEAWLDWQFLTELPSRYPEEAGFYPAIVGSIMIMLVIVVAVFPVGVAAAVYLEEYAPENGLLGRLVDLVEINIANLAGVPSVVYGLLALAVFINTIGMGTGTVVVGGLAVGLLILPIIIISSQEAIRAVPDSMRQASYGMGATKWQTTRTVVLPEALPGILTGSILAFGRAIGETAPLLMIGVAGAVFQAPGGFFDTTSAMPRQIFSWASQPNPDFRYGVLAAGVVTLLVVLLSMNAVAILIRNKYQRRT